MCRLETRNLRHRFPDGTEALRGVTIAFEPGSFTVLAGANGSGKTVFARHLNGLYRPTEGEVLLDGRSIFDDLSAARQAVGLVFQNAESQFVGQTVAQDTAFGPENLNLPAAEVARRVEESLRTVGLWERRDTPPHSLSGGQRRRAAIAGVLAMNPRVVLFDEPFSGLDYSGVRQVLEQLVRMRERGTTIIVISHQLDKLLAHADRLVLFHQGAVVADGSPQDVAPCLERYDVRNPLSGGLRLEQLSWLCCGEDSRHG